MSIKAGAVYRIPSRRGTRRFTIRVVKVTGVRSYGSSGAEYTTVLARRVRPAETSVSFGEMSVFACRTDAYEEI